MGRGARITNRGAVCKRRSRRNRERTGLFRASAIFRARRSAARRFTAGDAARIVGAGGRHCNAPPSGENARETHRNACRRRPAAVAARLRAHAAAAAAPAYRRGRPQAGKRRGDQGFFDLLCHPRHAERQKIQRHPDGDGDLRQPSPHRLHDRPRQGARSRKIFHHLHRCDRQRAFDLAEQFEDAAAHAVSEIHHPRHGGIAIPPGEGKVRHRPCRRGDRPVDGRHAGAAMGRQPSRFHGRAGGDGAAGEDAGLDAWR